MIPFEIWSRDRSDTAVQSSSISLRRRRIWNFDLGGLNKTIVGGTDTDFVVDIGRIFGCGCEGDGPNSVTSNVDSMVKFHGLHWGVKDVCSSVIIEKRSGKAS